MSFVILVIIIYSHFDTLQHPITHRFFPRRQVTTSGETSIPSSASIELPPIQVIADYRQAKSEANVASQSARMEEGLQLREGSYLNAVAEVGMLEHSLTTCLLYTSDAADER